MTLLDWWLVGLGGLAVVLAVLDEVLCRRHNARLLERGRFLTQRTGRWQR